MKKLFCDICEAPAKEATSEHLRHPYGEVYKTRGTVDGTFRANIEVRLGFGIVEHQTGFGGPPDLCPGCKVKLVEELLVKMKSKLLQS
jgi:hypothetical protein